MTDNRVNIYFLLIYFLRFDAEVESVDVRLPLPASGHFDKPLFLELFHKLCDANAGASNFFRKSLLPRKTEIIAPSVNKH